MPLLQILTDPQNFKFYAGGPGHTSTVNSFGQKSIPYGKDQFGGGWSKQPFVEKSIQNPPGQPENTGGPDFIVRGGTLFPGRISDDVDRLTKLLISPGTVGGLAFTVKQNLLSRTSVRTQGAPDNVVLRTNQGIYTPLNTIAQVGGSLPAAFLGTGLHLPFLLGQGNYYENVKRERETQGEPVDNRLYGLYSSKIQNINASFPGLRGFESLDPQDILSYKGGPDSPMGFGRTRITFADQRTGKNNPQYKTNQFQSGSLKSVTTDLTGNLVQVGGLSLTPNITRLPLPTNGSSVITPSNRNVDEAPSFPYLFTKTQIDQATTFQEQSSNTFTDFRQTLKQDPVTGAQAGKVLVSTDYSVYNLQKTFQIGNPGKVSRARNIDPTNLNNPLAVDADTIDQINYKKIGELDATSDLIPFYFKIFNPNGSMDLQFRAFIDSLSDNFNSDWQSLRYMGRGENFYTYNGFDRTVTMGFSIYAQTYPEIFRQYQRLNYLVSSTAPTYTGAGIMQGNFVRLTVGDYLNQVPGIIKSISVEIPSESPWETGRDIAGNDTDKGDKLPFLVRVSNLTFVPIYDQLPTTGTPFITMGNNYQGHLALP